MISFFLYENNQENLIVIFLIVDSILFIIKYFIKLDIKAI